MKFIKQFFHGLSIVGIVKFSRYVYKTKEKDSLNPKMEKVSLCKKRNLGLTPDGGKVTAINP